MVTISKYIEVDVDVEVDITDFTDEEIVDELHRRKISTLIYNPVLKELFWAYSAKDSMLVDKKLKNCFITN